MPPMILTTGDCVVEPAPELFTEVLFKLHVVGGRDLEGRVLHVPPRLLIFSLVNVNLMII